MIAVVEGEVSVWGRSAQYVYGMGRSVQLPAWSESVDYAGTPPYFPFKPKSNRQHAPAYPPRGKRHKREWLLPMNV